nr:helix-turn-helix transcriptional regulator [Pseudomonas sp. TH34]
METNVGIGDRLKEERERLGFSQTEFAAVAGASKNSQYNYEKGDRSPDADYLAAVAERGVDILYVVTGERKRQAAESISDGASEFLQVYEQVDPGDRQVLLRMASAFANAADSTGKKPASEK